MLELQLIHISENKLWNKLFLKDIYIPRVGVAMTVWWVIWYCYSFLPGSKCIFQLYSSGSSISWVHCTLVIFYFIMIVVTIIGIHMAILLFWTTRLGFCYKVALVLQIRTFVDVSALDIPFEYWIEHVASRLLYIMYRFSAMIFYRGVPGFATDCPCGVCCRGLTTCLLYVGPLLKI